VEAVAETVLNYIKHNAYRKDYKAYLKAGLRIGSGAIESAHRTVVQSRMKGSGQHWSKRGAQHILNLRLTYKSGLGHRVTKYVSQNLIATS
jgi:hypothetical protein